MRKLSKKEKYDLKKKKKEQKRQRKKRRKKIKKKIPLFLGLILGLGLIGWLLLSYQGSSQPKHPGIPQAEVTPKKYDAGTISMADGLLKHTFEIKNKGVGDLEIDKIWTSCMCTTARLRVGGEESGEFGMHSNPLFWSQRIAPGQTGFLEVSFDPSYHGPQGTGPVVRAVYLSTNDPENKKLEVRLIANVTQ